VPRLTKSQAERLVAAVDRAGDDLEANRRAVAVALGRLLGPERVPGEPADPRHWADLVRSAARRGGWSAQQTEALLAAAEPTTGADDRSPSAALEALWDLAAELNERRELAEPV
jgi:hypothetical protein